MNNKSKRRKMSIAAKKFARPNATKKIAHIILKYDKT